VTQPIDLLTKKIPEIVNAAVAEMKSLGDQGDAEAKQRYADLAGSSGAARIVLEGKGGADVYLISEGASLRADTQKPSAPVLLAIAVAAEAVELGLEELQDELEQGLAFARRRLVRLSPKRSRAAFDKLATEQLSFHLVIKDTPDFEEVRVKIATGSAEPPAKPKFTVTVDWETLEQVRKKKLKPQALLSKLQLSGDSARAMQLGMELMQRRSS
jgi:putative sterol carrier protein